MPSEFARHPIVPAAVVVAVLASAVACTETERANGESCLKDQDCLSGICSQLRCAAQPMLLDGAPAAPADAADTSSPPGPSPDAGADDSAGGAGDGPAEAVAEGDGTPMPDAAAGEDAAVPGDSTAPDGLVADSAE
jgi:hypothetical protein